MPNIQTRVIPNILLKYKLFCSVKKKVTNKLYTYCYETTKLIVLRLRPIAYLSAMNYTTVTKG